MGRPPRLFSMGSEEFFVGLIEESLDLLIGLLGCFGWVVITTLPINTYHQDSNVIYVFASLRLKRPDSFWAILEQVWMALEMLAA